MKKKINIFISLVLGSAFIAASYFVRNDMRTLHYAFLIIGLAVLAITIAEIYFALTKKGSSNDGSDGTAEKKIPPEYRRKGTLITLPERKFYRTLCELFADKYDIIYQVALHSVIDKITQNSYRNELFRIVDFCLVDKTSFAPLLLIELNDSSHKRADRIERDKKVSDICLSAKMPIIAFKTHEMDDTSHIKRVVKNNILRN